MWETLGEVISVRKSNRIERIDVNGAVFESTNLIAEEMNKYFVESVREVVATIDTQHLIPTTINQDQQHTLNSFKVIDMKQLWEILFDLMNLPNKSSPDEISVDFLKNTFQNIKTPLLHIINTSLKIGKVPNLLKILNIIPIIFIKYTNYIIKIIIY